jgi:hypothetical protein
MIGYLDAQVADLFAQQDDLNRQTSLPKRLRKLT